MLSSCLFLLFPPCSDSDSPANPRAYGYREEECSPEVPKLVETWAAKIGIFNLKGHYLISEMNPAEGH